MNKKILVILMLGLLIIFACSKKSEHNHTTLEEHHHEHTSHEGHHHTAHHGGVLNAINNCETGHTEVKVQDGMFELWFVGGGNNTDKSVRIKDEKITLTVNLKEGTAKEIILNANPIELAEEKIGDCSYFTAKVDWLKNIDHFTADGTINFKGKKMKLHIDYPHGFDPDHENCDHDHEKGEHVHHNHEHEHHEHNEDNHHNH